jgi:hypothetical protein
MTIGMIASPGRPAALRPAGDDERLDLDLAALLARQELLQCVHGAHPALDHRQTGEPLVVAGDDALGAAVGDEVVLVARLVRRVGEAQRLVRHHSQLGDDAAGVEGEAHRALRRLPGLVAVGAAADPQEGGGVAHVLGPHDGEPVRPLGAVDLLGGAPALRDELDGQGGVEVFVFGRDQAPAVGRIRRGDVTVEGGLAVVGASRGCDARHEERSDQSERRKGGSAGTAGGAHRRHRDWCS